MLVEGGAARLEGGTLEALVSEMPSPALGGKTVEF